MPLEYNADGVPFGRAVLLSHPATLQLSTTSCVGPTTPCTEPKPPAARGGHPVAIAFDARTRIVLRAETDYRTEELTSLHVDEEPADDLFVLPE